MIEEESFDFSFSGLKTAVLREVNRLKSAHYNNIYHYSDLVTSLSYETQESITDILVEKTIRAAQKYKVKSILLGGGVTANERLREKFQFAIRNLPRRQAGSQFAIFFPPPNLSTDNAAVIASSAYFNYKPQSWDKIQANPGLYFWGRTS